MHSGYESEDSQGSDYDVDSDVESVCSTSSSRLQATEPCFKVFVKNFPPSVSKDDLQAHVASLRLSKNVKHIRIFYGKDKKSKGCGYVSFTPPSVGRRAITSLNGSLLLGKHKVQAKQFQQRKKQNSSKHVPDVSQPPVESGGGSFKVFVGAQSGVLPPHIESAHLQEHFMQCQSTLNEVYIVKNPETSKSKGYGFACFKSKRAAHSAIQKFNGTHLRDCQLKLEFAREGKGGSSAGSSRPSRGRLSGMVSSPVKKNLASLPGKNPDAVQYKVFVGGLRESVQSQHIQNHFSNFKSSIVSTYIYIPKGDKPSRRCGFVVFSSFEAAENAVAALNGTKLHGALIRVQHDKHTTKSHDAILPVALIPDTSCSSLPKAASNCICLSNLNPEIDEATIKTLCEGMVTELSIVPVDSSSRQATVTFSSPNDAKKALDNFDGRIFLGQRVSATYKYLQPEALQPARQSRGTVSDGSLVYPVKITQLAPTVTEVNLHRVFKAAGEIVECRVFASTIRYALVNYSLESEADEAVRMFNGKVIDGMKVNVSKKSALAREPHLPSVEPRCQPVTVQISNLPTQMPLYELQKRLTDIFSAYQSAMIENVCPPNACVKFSDVNQAYSAAADLHQSIIGDSLVNVRVVTAEHDHKPPDTPTAVVAEKFKDVIQLSSAECNLLTAINSAGSSLYQQLIQPFKANPNVKIELVLSEVAVHFTGEQEAVKSAHSHFRDNLQRHIPIELECCQALMKIRPALPKEMKEQYGVSLIGLQEGTMPLKLDGPQSGVSKAHAVMGHIISSFQMSEVHTQVVLTSNLLVSLTKRFENEGISVCVSQKPGSHDATIYSFSSEHQKRAVNIVTSKPSIRHVPFTTNPSLQHSLLDKIAEDLSVSVETTEAEQKIYIRGFVREDVLSAQERVKDCMLKLSVQFAPIECSPQQILYLRYKLDFQREATQGILDALPAEVLIEPNRPPHFKGSPVDIAQSQKQLLEGPLLCGLQFRTFTFRGQHKFYLQLEQHVLKPLKREHPSFEYIKEDSEGELANWKGRRGSTKSEEAQFMVTVFSQHSKVFETAVADLENVTPTVKTLMITHSDAMERIQTIAEDRESQYRVRIVIPKDSKTRVLIFGLTEKEASVCLNELRDCIESTIEEEKYIRVDRNQIRYFQQKRNDEWKELKGMCKSLKVFDKQKQEKETVLIRVEGTVKQVRSVCRRLYSLKDLEYFSKVFQVTVDKRFNKMWLKHWDALIKEKEELLDLIIIVEPCNARSTAGSSDTRSPMIEYEFTICGGDENGSIVVERELSTPRTMQKVVNLSQVALSELDRGRKEKRLKIDQYMVHMFINSQTNTVTLTAPIELSDELEAAAGEIELFVGNCTLTERDIVIEDPVIGLVLHSRSKSSPHLMLANQIAKPHSVTIQYLKRPRSGLRLRGSQDSIAKVEQLIQQNVIARIQSSIDTMEFPVNSALLPFFKTPEFLHFSATIRDELCVLSTFPKSQAENKVLKSVYLKTTTSASCIKLEICRGNMVNENVDAIVNAANEDLKHVGGLAKAILDAGGTSIQAESNQYIQANGKVKAGSVVCLGAGNLLCKKILHAVGPQWAGGSSGEEQTLYFTVLSCLQACQREGFESVAIPAVSAGIFGVPIAVCVKVSMKAVRDFCQVTTKSCVTNVRFVLFEDYMAESFALALDSEIFLGCTLPGSQSVPSSPAVSQSFVWQWMDDDGSFKPYDPQVNIMLNQRFSQSPIGTVTFSRGKHSYIVDLGKMVQTNVQTNFKREIRGTHTDSTPTSPTQTPVWKFHTDLGKWMPYVPNDSQAIEAMFKSQRPGQLVINGKTYTFDFQQMCQINVDTSYKRPIQRSVKSATTDADQVQKQTLERKEKPVIVTLRGPTANLVLAKQRLDGKLNGALDNGDIAFPASLEGKVHSIVQQQKLQFKITPEEKGAKRRVTFQGLSSSVNKAKSDIQEEIINFHVTASESLTAVAPPEWQPQSQNLQLYQVTVGSPEWAKVESSFKITLPTVRVIDINRIQNKWLWERYAQHKQRLTFKNGGKVNEKDLFHGTRSNDPKLIYEGEDGFDSRYSSTGMWGLANYFAVNANYSHDYAYTRSDGTKEMFMAKVLTGESYECASDPKLRLPPEKPGIASGTLKFAKVRYDTVTGTTRGSQVFMTYDNDKAYPAYLIHYSNY